MALIFQKARPNAIIPLLQTKRYRSKINIQKPRAPHYERAVVERLVKPYFAPEILPPLIDQCKKYKKDENVVENKLQMIIARELLDLFKSSQLVCFFHLNPMAGDDKFKARLAFHKLGMTYREHGRDTVRLAVQGTNYEAVLEHYMVSNSILFSPEPKIKQVLKILKRHRQLVLICGIYSERYLSKEELVKYADIPDLRTAQAQLVQTLQGVGGQVVARLTQSQNSLVSNLQERVKQLELEK